MPNKKKDCYWKHNEKKKKTLSSQKKPINKEISSRFGAGPGTNKASQSKRRRLLSRRQARKKRTPARKEITAHRKSGVSGEWLQGNIGLGGERVPRKAMKKRWFWKRTPVMLKKNGGPLGGRKKTNDKVKTQP